jgi:glycosyltransferase involved in cell wall biosynthesis
MKAVMTASASPKQLLVLGTRGVPAAHGGFETFAEQLSLYLAGRGWEVSVYCQQDNASPGDVIHQENWHGVTRIVVPVRGEGSVGSILFDWASVRDARKRGGIPLVLGYNTGLFSPWLLLGKEKLFINMDGIEWRRPKWSLAIRIWFWINERIAMHSGHVLFADHPEIARHLAKSVRESKIVMIPYGGYLVDKAPVEPVHAMGLESNGYFLTVCRIEPENSILEIVRAFSCARRNRKLVMLGKFDPANAYHNAVRAAASDEVVFPGPIYDQDVLASLRSHVRLYCHGHTVGGTNPSLVEALGAGCPILAQNNRFNTWVAGPDQFYFDGEASCAKLFDSLADDDTAIERAREGARAQFQRNFQLASILSAYEKALSGERITA